MTPVKKFSAGSVSCAIWENEALVNGKNVGILKDHVACCTSSFTVETISGNRRRLDNSLPWHLTGVSSPTSS
jgi:hypothetical protein